MQHRVRCEPVSRGNLHLNGTTINETWKEKIYSYGGIALPGFPNLFTLYGPFAPVNNVPPLHASPTPRSEIGRDPYCAKTVIAERRRDPGGGASAIIAYAFGCGSTVVGHLKTTETRAYWGRSCALASPKLMDVTITFCKLMTRNSWGSLPALRTVSVASEMLSPLIVAASAPYLK